jgi:hypothetical protein
MVIEKMIALGLMSTEQAIEDEQLAPNEVGEDINDINL